MPNRILVTGGTGRLGRSVVHHLLSAGHQVRVASRDPAPVGQLLDHQWARVDYRTRAGLDGALAGVDVVVHCTGGSARAEAETIAALLSSGKRAGCQHLIYLSIVGVDLLHLRYYRSKLASEKALIASGVPWSILRTTQFHELALTLVKVMCKLPVGIVPKGVRCQPVAVDEVAARLAELAGGPPLGRAPEFGGPQIVPLTQLARMYLAAIGKRKPVLEVPLPGKLGRRLRTGAGLTPDHGDGLQSFAEFLRAEVHR